MSASQQANEGLGSLFSRVKQTRTAIDRGAKSRETISTPLTQSTRASVPKALVLLVTIAHCACGRTHRHCNTGPSVRFEIEGVGSHIGPTRHLERRSDLEPFRNLPREISEYEINIPFCEGCFVLSEASAPARSAAALLLAPSSPIEPVSVTAAPATPDETRFDSAQAPTAGDRA